jgi:hypothetical protein
MGYRLGYRTPADFARTAAILPFWHFAAEDVSAARLLGTGLNQSPRRISGA